MEYKRLFEGSYRLMSLIWDNEPIGSMSLVRLCSEELGWKKSTTFTMLKKLAEKGLIKNEDSVVTSLVPREMVLRAESQRFVEQTFSGSLPEFLTAFFGGKTIDDAEAETLYALIEAHRKEQKP